MEPLAWRQRLFIFLLGTLFGYVGIPFLQTLFRWLF